MTSARRLVVLLLSATACTSPVVAPPPTATLPSVSPAPAKNGAHDPNDEYGMAVSALGKVSSFSALLNAGSYDRIWIDTDDLLRRETTKDQFLAMLDDVHRTYGVPTHSTLLGFQFEDRSGPDGGTFLYMLFELELPSGRAEEQFTFRVTSSNLVTLVAYHIERVTPTPMPTLRG